LPVKLRIGVPKGATAVQCAIGEASERFRRDLVAALHLRDVRGGVADLGREPLLRQASEVAPSLQLSDERFANEVLGLPERCERV